MAERSPFPVYGNVTRLYGDSEGIKIIPHRVELAFGGVGVQPDSFPFKGNKYSFSRAKDKNILLWQDSPGELKYTEIPFITSYGKAIELLKDTLQGLKLSIATNISLSNPSMIHSQPTDSVLKPMMHRSDNFFAEQILLMVSNERLGVMNDEKIIDTLLKTDFKDLPQKPGWVDGSGSKPL